VVNRVILAADLRFLTVFQVLAVHSSPEGNGRSGNIPGGWVIRYLT
jgi:hypothetical protein